MRKPICYFLETALVFTLCLAIQHLGLSNEPTPMAGDTIEIPNPGLEDRHKDWMISDNGDWCSDGAHQGTTCALINSASDARIARCVLCSPKLPQVQPGMKVRVIFYARWLSGDNLVHITFHEDDPYWISEIPLWQAQIPKDGHWHRMQADLHVPPFLHGETALRLCVGVTNLRWPADADVKNTEYLLDDISMTVLEAGKPAIPARPIVPSFEKDDPRDEPSPYGVFWTAWKTYCRTPISEPHQYDKTRDEIRRELDLVQQIGVKWIRTIWRWDKLEWERGKFDFALLDFVVAEAWRRDIRIVPALTTPPRWASPAPQDDDEYNIYPPNMADWEAFVFHTVDHFKERVKYWEIWNEPNIQDRWNGSIEDYFQLQKAAFLAARRADPRSKLLMGSFSGAPAYHLDALLRLGAGDYFDVLSYHPYPRKHGLKKVDYLTRRMRAVLAEHGCEDHPIWFTEIGCKVVNAGSPEERAQFLADLYKHPLEGAVEKRFWFTFDIWRKRPDGMGHGLINTSEDPIQLCPAYHAYGKVTGKSLGRD